MKVGLVYPQVELRGDPQAVHDIGVGAEQLGFDSLLVYDHVVGAEHDHRQPPLRGPYTRIARRVCAFEWRRTDPVGDGSTFADTYTRRAARFGRHRVAHPGRDTGGHERWLTSRQG